MFAAFALTVYFVLCLAICAGIALYVAYPARGRDLPERPSTLRSRRDTQRGLLRRLPARRTTGGRRMRNRDLPQRG